MKIGVNLNIDVTKLDKRRFFKGEKGTYCDLTVFIDTDHQNKHNHNGYISQKSEKDERDMPIIGNAKVFWKGEGSQGNPQPAPGGDDLDSETIPF